MYGCELLSNFVSLTDCKQPSVKILLQERSCELLSNFVSLTDCKQHEIGDRGDTKGCELLSNFVSLTDCKQRRRTVIIVKKVVNCFQTLYL